MAGFDPIIAMNFTLCVLIVLLGCLSYLKSRESICLYIAGAYVLFTISHLVSLLAMQGMETALVVIRALGYFVLVLGLYSVWTRNPAATAGKKRR